MTSKIKAFDKEINGASYTMAHYVNASRGNYTQEIKVWFSLKGDEAKALHYANTGEGSKNDVRWALSELIAGEVEPGYYSNRDEFAFCVSFKLTANKKTNAPTAGDLAAKFGVNADTAIDFVAGHVDRLRANAAALRAAVHSVDTANRMAQQVAEHAEAAAKEAINFDARIEALRAELEAEMKARVADAVRSMPMTYADSGEEIDREALRLIKSERDAMVANATIGNGRGGFGYTAPSCVSFDKGAAAFLAASQRG